MLEETAITGPLTQFPITISGRLTQPGETDAYWLEIADSATLTFEAVSRAAGFDPAVTLYEPSGSWFDARRLNRIGFNDEPLYFRASPQTPAGVPFPARRKILREGARFWGRAGLIALMSCASRPV